jgi:hypothetical protein
MDNDRLLRRTILGGFNILSGTIFMAVGMIYSPLLMIAFKGEKVASTITYDGIPFVLLGALIALNGMFMTFPKSRGIL